MSLDRNSKVKYKGGKVFTLTELATMAGVDPMDNGAVMALANALYNRGDITEVDDRSKLEKTIEKANDEELFKAVVNNMTVEEQAHKNHIRQQKLDNTTTHTFDLAFITTIDATKFELWVRSMGINQTTILKDEGTGAVKLFIKEVTPQEYTKITTRYQAENAINGAMNATGKVLNGTTNAVNYGLTNVVAPTAKIVGEASMNLGKGIFHTGVKTLAGLINSGAKAVTDTKIALMTDPECLRATAQLMEAKNTMRRGINSKIGNSSLGGGITNY